MLQDTERIVEQMKKDGRIQQGCMGSVMREEESENAEYIQHAWDDVTGVELDRKGIQSAREDEIHGIKRFEVYTKVPVKVR